VEILTLNKHKFKFQYLPDYASYLLMNHLEEFVTVGIRFCREEELPMLKPLASIPEKELVRMSIESNEKILTGLINNNIAEYIELNLNNWLENKIGHEHTGGKKLLDKFEIVPEDLTLSYFIRRKLFSYFLYGYTQSAAIQQLLISEVDVYTSQEELASLKIYLEIQRQSNLN
jgi:hypothetical protein